MRSILKKKKPYSCCQLQGFSYWWGYTRYGTAWISYMGTNYTGINSSYPDRI